MASEADVVLAADTFYSPFYLNQNERAEFALNDGSKREIILLDKGVEQRLGWVIWADLLIDGHPIRLGYAPFTMQALYEPKVVNGMRIGLDAVKGLPGIVDEGNASEANDPPADVRLWVNDAGMPLAPNCYLWSALPQDIAAVENFPHTMDYRFRQDRDVHPSGVTLRYNRKTGWLGEWTYGIHNGLDIDIAVGTELYSVIDNCSHLGILSGGHRIYYERERTNGDVWRFGNSHCDAMVGSVGDVLNAGDVYALSGDEGAGIPHYHAWLFLTPKDQTRMALNPWPIMYQGLENRKTADGFIRAHIAPVGPAAENESITFSAEGSRACSGRTIQKFSWYFDDGSTAEGEVVQKAFADAGMHQAIVVIDDGYLKDYFEVHFTVGTSGQVDPKITAGIYHPDQVALRGVGEEVQFGILAESHDGSEPTVQWHFGDGDTATGAEVSHVYQEAGRYIVIAKVFDQAGACAMNAYLFDTKEWPDRPADSEAPDLKINHVRLQGSFGTSVDEATLHGEAGEVPMVLFDNATRWYADIPIDVGYRQLHLYARAGEEQRRSIMKLQSP